MAPRTGYASLRRAAAYASERRVFNRPIGQNQAIQHPLARSWCELEAAKLWLVHAAKRFDETVGVAGATSSATISKEDREEVGAACNGVKYLAAEAAYKACETAGELGHSLLGAFGG
jgi:acyl-CoA dehydrogenase